MFKKLGQICLISCILSLIFFNTAIPVKAVDDFQTRYQSEYRVLENGTTRVTQQVSLTNNLANVYVDKYSFAIGSTRVNNISGYDDLGPLKINVQTLENQTKLNFEFNQQVTGKGNSLDFVFSFDSQDFAVKSGQVWEISLPKLNQTDQFEDYSVVLITPASFDQPALISPQPSSIITGESDNQYLFNKQTVKDMGISATFGEQQIFDFELDYHLKNDRTYPVRTEIALPPDTSYQRIYLNDLSPQPKNIRVDVDGNWLAEYQLKANEALDIKAQGQAKVFLEPQPISAAEQLSNYLSKDQYWPVNDPDIKTKAQELETIENIYQFVTNWLVYDYGRIDSGVERLGADQALANPESALCMEFTDLFVSLARSAGIPARAITGYAYTHNSKLKPLAAETDLLHSWPEYYDQSEKVWRQVDPTWENTTGGVDFFHNFDLNHLTLAIHGQSSTYPLPAGAYKINGREVKDVNINFGQSITPKTQLASDIKLGIQGLPWQLTSAQLNIANKGNYALYDLTVKPVNNDLIINQNQLAVLPPLAEHQLNVQLKSKPGLKSKPVLVAWQVGESQFSQTVNAPGWFDPLYLPYLLVLIIPSVFVLFSFTLAHKIVKKR